MIGKNIDEATTPVAKSSAGGTRVIERERVVYVDDDGRKRYKDKHKRKHRKHCDDDHPGRGHAHGKYKHCD